MTVILAFGVGYYLNMDSPLVKVVTCSVISIVNEFHEEYLEEYMHNNK